MWLKGKKNKPSPSLTPLITIGRYSNSIKYKCALVNVSVISADLYT